MTSVKTTKPGGCAAFPFVHTYKIHSAMNKNEYLYLTFHLIAYIIQPMNE